MRAQFSAWRERRNQRYAAYLDKVRRVGVAKYCLRWGTIVALVTTALFGLDLYYDNCCGRTLADICVFAGVFGALLGLAYFLICYVSLHFEMWLCTPT